MKKILFPLVLALLAPGRVALAQTKLPVTAPRLITGIVRDDYSANELAYVQVTVLGDTAHTTTDATGRFQLRVLPTVPVVLRFVRHNYVSQEMALTPESRPTLKVWLKRPPIDWTARSGWAEARRIQRQNRRAATNPQSQATTAK